MGGAPPKICPVLGWLTLQKWKSIHAFITKIKHNHTVRTFRFPQLLTLNNKNPSIIFSIFQHTVRTTKSIPYILLHAPSPHMPHRRCFVGRSHIIPGMETRPTTFMPRVACQELRCRWRCRPVLASCAWQFVPPLTGLKMFYIPAPINCMDLNGILYNYIYST